MMDVRNEIAERVAKLSPQLQERVLKFVSSLEPPAVRGESGASLARLAGTVDEVSAREMARAIEEECERVDASHW